MCILHRHLIYSKTVGKIYYTDHFHPNEVGYTYMAERLVQNVVSKLKLEQGGVK